MSTSRGYSVKEGYNVDDLDQNVVKQVQKGKNWDENDQARYDAIVGAKSKAKAVVNKSKTEPKAEPQQPSVYKNVSKNQPETPAYQPQNETKSYQHSQDQTINPYKSAKGKAQAHQGSQVKNTQQQTVKQDNDVNTTITGDNNKVFNNQDNSIRQYGGDNRSLIINEGEGKGSKGYYNSADKAITMGTLGGFYDVDDSPAAQAKFVDQQQTMNRDAQKKYQNYGSQTASKYSGYRGGDVNIRGLQSRLDRNHMYFFDLAKLQEVKTYGDRAAVTKYPEFKFGDPIKPVESKAGDIADKYRDDIDDM